MHWREAGLRVWLASVEFGRPCHDWNKIPGKDWQGYAHQGASISRQAPRAYRITCQISVEKQLEITPRSDSEQVQQRLKGARCDADVLIPTE